MFKLTQKVLVLSLIITIALFYVGCQESESINAPAFTNSLAKFSLPTGATLESAELHIWVSSEDDQLVNIHRVTSPWTEATVTWENFGGAYDNMNVINNFTADAIGWKVVDILSVVQGWVSGDYPDYGILLDQVNVHYPWTHYNSSEGTYKPFLKIGYTVNGGPIQYLDIPAFEDSYISEIASSENFGNALFLYTGWIANSPYTHDFEKQSLLKFDIEPTPDGGCTLTPGYWKTHSKYGPASYDETWAQIDEDTDFFLSGKSYFQVINTAPKGNAYYNLSFHYIAAKLNQLNGADFSAAQSAFNDATALFNTYTPDQIAALKGNHPVRNQFINLASILGQYNEGYIGPGHCEIN